MNRPEPQRCRDVRDALARPPAQLDCDSQTDHLAECPQCARAAESAQLLADAWNQGRPEPPTAGFDALWSNVMAQVETGVLETRRDDDHRPAVAVRKLIDHRRPRRKAAIVAIVLAQTAAAVLVGWTLWPGPEPVAPEVAANVNAHVAETPTAVLSVLDGVPAVIVVEPSEVTILRVNRQGSLDRRDIDSLEISETETVGFDTTVLGYFEGLGGS